MAGLADFTFLSELDYPTIIREGTGTVSTGGTEVVLATGIPEDADVMAWVTNSGTKRNANDLVYRKPNGDLCSRTLGQYIFRVYGKGPYDGNSNSPFTFHSDMVAFGRLERKTIPMTTPSVSMAHLANLYYYSAWNYVNSTGFYTFDIKWKNPSLQAPGGSPISAPDIVNYIRYGGHARFSNINASAGAGPIGVRYYPYVEMDYANHRWRVAVRVMNHFVTASNPYTVPSRSWNFTVSIYSIPNSYQ